LTGERLDERVVLLLEGRKEGRRAWVLLAGLMWTRRSLPREGVDRRFLRALAVEGEVVEYSKKTDITMAQSGKSMEVQI
jgi:hypothetical protein